MTSQRANVADYLLKSKEVSRIALQFVQQDYTYGRLQSAATAIANYLLEIGAVKGDRAIVLGDNSFFWVAAYLGIMRAGLVAVPLPRDISPTDLAHVLFSTKGRIAFTEAGSIARDPEPFRGMHIITDRVLPSIRLAASQISLAELESEPNIKARPYPEVSPYDLAALMFTSGSTGRPRGVMVSHANIIANTDSIVEYLQLTCADRMMTILPFHYCFGASLLHTHLRVGGSLVIDSRFMYPEVVLQRMHDKECTGFAGAPSHFQILLRKSSLRTKKLPHLRHIQQAGGHLAPMFVRELCQALPGTRIFIMYGQTEATARLAYLPPELLEKKAGSIGKAIPGVKLKVLNDSGEEVRSDEVGEIVAEGENITQGYWCDPEETARSFRDGKLHTGDLAKVDDEGYLYIVDRAKSFLKCGGRRISTRQLEDLILEFQPLLEAAVIGMQDDVLGEAVKAFVVPRNGDTAGLKDRLRQYCRERMPQEFVPKQIVVLDFLPKSSTGKVLKQILKNLDTPAPVESQPAAVG